MNVSGAVRLKASLILAILAVCPASVAIAADLEMSLQVRSAKQRVGTKRTEEDPSTTKPKPRPVLTIRENEDLFVSWEATNVSKHDTYRDVLIHCVVVSERAAGQVTMPSLKEPVQESALTMDFKPGGRASGTFSLLIDQPGTYLVRVETRNLLEQHGHDYYVAIDLVRK
jgi:hypothetical protein